MQTASRHLITLLAATAAGLAGAAQAQPQADGTGLYGTLGYKQGDDIEVGSLQARAGARLTPYLGVEGELGAGVKADKFSVAPLELKTSLKWEAAIYGVAYLPLSPKADLLARVGYGTTRFEFESNGGGVTAPVSASRNRESWNFGVGGQYHFDELNGVRLDYTRQDFNGGMRTNDTLAIAYSRRF
jgi:opacity protein-like surface antigen